MRGLQELPMSPDDWLALRDLMSRASNLENCPQGLREDLQVALDTLSPYLPRAAPPGEAIGEQAELQGAHQGLPGGEGEKPEPADAPATPALRQVPQSLAEPAPAPADSAGAGAGRDHSEQVMRVALKGEPRRIIHDLFAYLTNTQNTLYLVRAQLSARGAEAIPDVLANVEAQLRDG